MPAVVRLHHVCSSCGAASPKWQGRCSTCGEWNSLVEAAAPAPAAAARPARPGVPAATPQLLSALAGEEVVRQSTGLAEVDRALGGGVVPGSLVLLGGDPGIGKSTLALQVARGMGRPGRPALYCAGEESAAQVAFRARRTGCDTSGIEILAETDLDVLIATIEARRPGVAVIDSVQTAMDPSVPGTPGSVAQVRGAVGRLLGVAKATGVPLILVGHVTKEGAIAGPRTLEHMVDVVLYLEGERHGDNRLLRGVKNRFGATGDLGLLAMTADGISDLEAPGRAFLEEASLGVPGAVLTVTCEGVRPLAVEVQALVASTAFGLPRRTASGFDLGRLHLLLAVLEKRARVTLAQSDVYVNAVGGVRLSDPAVDLAVALAVASAARDRLVPNGLVAFGEVGLGGELRRVPRLEQRLHEAATLGMERALVPPGASGKVPATMRCQTVRTLSEALAVLT